MTLFWIVIAVALAWGIWKLSRMPGSASDGGDSTGSSYYTDGGGSTTSADCSDSGSDGGSCDSGGDGGGGD